MFEKTWIGVFAAILLMPSAAFAEGASPSQPDRPSEIVVIGDGEVMDALHLAVDEQVAVINGDGGVMGQPLKVSRVDAACADTTPEEAIEKSKEIAARRPLLVFQSYCAKSGLRSAATYAGRNILFMAVGEWPADLTQSRAGPTIFRLSPNHRQAQEIAFHIATAATGRLEPLGVPDALAKTVFRELQKGFAATPEEQDRWGGLIEGPSLVVNSNLIHVSLSSNNGADEWGYDPETMASATLFVPTGSDHRQGRRAVIELAKHGWQGRAIFFDLGHSGDAEKSEGKLPFPGGVVVSEITRQPFYLGKPPEGAKAYTAFHPDWVAGFWQVMKEIKYSKTLDGREIAATLGGKPFFSRAPWLMLQSHSRFVPPELRQRFNDNGDLRMAGYKLEQIGPK